MQDQYIDRKCHVTVADYLEDFQAVAILGPRQCGKTTLAKALMSRRRDCVYLDLEKPSDRNKLQDPELFFRLNHDKLVCLDEIQRMADLFEVLRGVIDERARNGQFLILGSASPDLIRQSSETLAGRIGYLELTPFMLAEIDRSDQNPDETLRRYWLRGGYPRSFLAEKDKTSWRWRENFIRTFLERDISQLGVQIASEAIRRLWLMCSHVHGQLLNLSKLGGSLGVTHPTVRSYIELLTRTYMLRQLQPFEANLKKRLVKSPKIYIRDAGLLHALLGIETFDTLLGHPIFGASWEGLVLENVIEAFPGWRTGFYRTAAGAELDLVLEKGARRIGVECKASMAPQLSRGFWNSIADLDVDEAWVIAPVDGHYPIAENVTVASLAHFLDVRAKQN